MPAKSDAGPTVAGVRISHPRPADLPGPGNLQAPARPVLREHRPLDRAAREGATADAGPLPGRPGRALPVHEARQAVGTERLAPREDSGEDEGRGVPDRRQHRGGRLTGADGNTGTHTWNSTIDDVERPNRIVWDLDPGPKVAWKQVVDAAKVVRDVLKTLGLESWVKTTGGRGLHVVVPIKPARDWSECLDFARNVSEAIERTDPIYTTTFRQGRNARS
jgi:hypothetical protein